MGAINGILMGVYAVVLNECEACFWAYKTKIYAKRFTMFTTSCLGCQQFYINEAVCPPFTWYEWDSFY